MNNNFQSELREIKKLLSVQTDEPLSIDEASKFTGLKKSYVYKLCSLKEIPFYKPNGKKIYFSKNELMQWIFRNKHKSRGEIEAEAESYLNKGSN